MAEAIALRADHGAGELRRRARTSRDAARTRRLLALAAIGDGASRTEAARIGGVGLQIVRDWVARFDAEGPDGRCGPPRAGQGAAAEARAARGARAGARGGSDARAARRRARAARPSGAVAAGRARRLARPADARARAAPHGLAQALRPPAGSRAGPRGAGGVQENLPAELGAIRATLPPEAAVEIRWRDEARAGQKNGITRRWARHEAPRAARPAHPAGARRRPRSDGGRGSLLRRHLPGQGQGRGPGDARRRPRGDAGAPRRE